MLQSVDIVIGFTVIMLVVSLAVTTITQVVVSFLNLRGAALKHGVAQLLALIDKGVSVGDAYSIADQILRDPLVGQQGFLGLRGRLATVVQREELTKLLLGFGLDPATNPWPTRSIASTRAKVAALQTTLRASLKNNGIDDPDATLAKIRMATLELEKTNPELSNSARTNTAILNFAASDFIGKLNAWFDQTIDRVSDQFAAQTRIVAAIAATVVAVVLQLNSIDIINQLATDPGTRAKFVELGLGLTKSDANGVAPAAGARPATSATPAVAGGQPADAGKPVATMDSLSQATLDSARQAVLTDLIKVSTFDAAWWSSWTLRMWVGVMLSALLLSLGAPFWYETLKTLLKLKSALSTKDDSQRAERQSTQAPAAGEAAGPAAAAPSASSALPAAFAGGEAGDLRAVG
jgi:hypothetical protein